MRMLFALLARNQPANSGLFSRIERRVGVKSGCLLILQADTELDGGTAEATIHLASPSSCDGG